MYISTSYNLYTCNIKEVQINTSFVHSCILIRVMKGASP